MKYNQTCPVLGTHLLSTLQTFTVRSFVFCVAFMSCVMFRCLHIQDARHCVVAGVGYCVTRGPLELRKTELLITTNNDAALGRNPTLLHFLLLQTQFSSNKTETF